MQREVKAELVELLEEKRRRASRSRINQMYPDTGPLRRELYPKHLAFFRAGTGYRQRLMLAANRVGKTMGTGLYELVLHLTGNYPHWWEGRRFNRPIRSWSCGDTGKTIREILQVKLLGPIGSWGTGLIPGDLIVRVSRAMGVADAVDTIFVKHVTGGTSQVTLKSYDQRREAFQGSEQDVIHEDEEPPLDIHTECLMRTMTCNGMLMLTFTPLLGMSDVVLSFLPGGRMDSEQPDKSKYVITATWDDVPHLTEEAKAELWASLPPHQRDARSKGIPQLGAGAIYPVPESDILVDDFPIPEHWPKAYAMDVGWNRTAAVWGALDRETQTLYLYSEHYRGQAEPIVHAEAVKARGAWIKGVIDPAARGRSQNDGNQLLEQYLALGLDLTPAKNAVEAGIYAVWSRLSGGKLKVFRSLTQWLQEFRLYRRNEKGAVVKENDHLQDCTRYLLMSGLDIMAPPPVERKVVPVQYEYTMRQLSSGWMG